MKYNISDENYEIGMRKKNISTRHYIDFAKYLKDYGRKILFCEDSGNQVRLFIYVKTCKQLDTFGYIFLWICS